MLFLTRLAVRAMPFALIEFTGSRPSSRCSRPRSRRAGADGPCLGWLNPLAGDRNRRLAGSHPGRDPDRNAVPVRRSNSTRVPSLRPQSLRYISVILKSLHQLVDVRLQGVCDVGIRSPHIDLYPSGSFGQLQIDPPIR